MDDAIGEIQMTEDMGGEVGAAVKKLKALKEVKCHGICFKMTSTDDIRGYPHDGGIPDKDGKLWWVYVHCNNPLKDRKCDYDTSWGKIRELRDEEPKKKDDWKAKYIKAIQDCNNVEEIGNVVNKIYEDGFEDGKNDEEPEEPPEPLPYHDLD